MQKGAESTCLAAAKSAFAIVFSATLSYLGLNASLLGFLAGFLVGAPALALPPDEIKVPAQPPPDTDFVKGLAYSKTMECHKQFAAAVASGKAFCTKYLKDHPGERNMAIVSDLDETLLDNREGYANHPTSEWGPFDAWLKEARAPALKDTLDFLTWAHNNGFAIIFITGRPEYDRLPTIENLIKIGVHYDALYLRPEGPHEKAEIYKAKVRTAVEKMGFKIVENIGDQYSDLAGGYSLDCVKLPNHMYFLP